MPGGERNVEGAEIGEEGVEELKVATCYNVSPLRFVLWLVCVDGSTFLS